MASTDPGPVPLAAVSIGEGVMKVEERGGMLAARRERESGQRAGGEGRRACGARVEEKGGRLVERRRGKKGRNPKFRLYTWSS